MPNHSSHFTDLVASHQTRHARAYRFSRNPFRRRRHQPSLSADSNDPSNQPKPIYIYPGLLRIVRDKAIALDNQCPAVHYKCRECRKSPNHNSSPPCSHQASCPICLDDFHGKDLVRRLPCNINHVFHSKCILDWFISQHRCPLCNEPVSSNPTPKPIHQPHHRVPSSDFQASPTDPRFSHRRRARSYRGLPTFTMDRSRETRLPSQEARLSDSTRDTTSQSTTTAEPPALDQTCQDDPETLPKSPQLGEKGKKKSRGPRRYSYIVHDSVRMELNPVIPV